MSFQGDVAGIGLAELLQSIARGRREGVLTLTGRNGLRSHLGLQSGVLYLLPAPDEDPTIWRERTRQAWVHDPDARVDALRMSEIARAHRVELLYRLLDCEGVHFRFEPGPLPEHPNEVRAEDVEPGARRMPSVHCEGIAVEFMLLEYARISDEMERSSGAPLLSDHAVPRPLDKGTPPTQNPNFYRQCDGTSSLQEIADRLAWPIRQVRLVAMNELAQGRLRCAAARELLVLAQRELERGYLSRAASRLSAWVQTSPPGPCDEGDAFLLEAEWKADRMPALLNLMPTREARTLLRRMDHALQSPQLSVRHWRELNRLHRQCSITHMRRIVSEHRCTTEHDTPSVRELLDLSRTLRDAKHPRRAAALLRIAASQVPSTIPAQLELGMGMIAAGLEDEARSWILSASASLIEDGLYEKSVPPLRALLEAAPACREARTLLNRARSLSMRRNIVRKHSVVALAILLSLSLGAYVQVRMDRTTERKLGEIANLMGQPNEALALLEQHFPDDKSPRLQALRVAIEERQRHDEETLRSVWYTRYSDAQLECTLGDPLVGLRRAMDLPTPPPLSTIDEPWPLVSDLFNGLAARMEANLRAMGPPVIDANEQIHLEQRLTEAVTRQQEAARQGKTRHDLSDYEARLEALGIELERRGQERAMLIAERDRLDKLNMQDMLLGAARSHDKAGDNERALDVYRRLLESDTTGKLERLFARDMAELEERHASVLRARELAREGRHSEALELLHEELGSTHAAALPWRLEAYPAGAEIRFPDGTLQTAPIVHESRAGERLVLQVSGAECTPYELVVDGPADRVVWLTRAPDRIWRAAGRVEALPVSVGRDHVVGDRSGKIARIGAASEPLWERTLGALGGVSRAPVFLPKKPGSLMILTEDGEAWIVDARDGNLEGPYDMGSPPITGPIATQGAIVARLADGREVRWEQRLQPTEVGTSGDSSRALGEIDEERAQYGSSAGLEVMRREIGSHTALDSPWTPMRVEITADIYRVLDRDGKRDLFYVHREGDWNYLAWEAPHAQLPTGRLWISDGAGLRAYLP